MDRWVWNFRAGEIGWGLKCIGWGIGWGLWYEERCLVSPSSMLMLMLMLMFMLRGKVGCYGDGDMLGCTTQYGKRKVVVGTKLETGTGVVVSFVCDNHMAGAVVRPEVVDWTVVQVFFSSLVSFCGKRSRRSVLLKAHGGG